MEDGTCAEESSAGTNLLRMLENGEGELYGRVADFLRPFGDLILIRSNFDPKSRTFAASKKTKKRKGVIGDDAALLRQLGKRFLPFLSEALKILRSSLLWKCPRIKREEDELFAIYHLLLDCLSCVSACLAGKPYSVHLQRYRFIICLETRGRFYQAWDEGFTLLESLVSTVSPVECQKGRKKKLACSGSSFLPDSTNKDFSSDVQLPILVVELVLTLIRCASKSKTKSDASYRRVLIMAEEIRPWLRFLGSEAYNKHNLSLLDALSKCSLFLARKSTFFAPQLVHNFCLETLRQWSISSSKDQFPKIARQICSSVSISSDGRFALMLEILECLLDSMPCKCKNNMIEYVNEFLEFVHYVAGSLVTTNSSSRINAFKILSKKRSNLQEVSLPVASILGFYAVGLAIGRIIQPQSFNNELDYLQIFGDSLSTLATNFDDKDNEFLHDLCGCLRKTSSLQLEPKRSCPDLCMHGDVSFFSFLDALAFLCDQLDAYVALAWKDMKSKGNREHSMDQDFVLDAFHQFCSMFLDKLNEKSYRVRLFESRLVLFRVVIASLKFSFLTSKDCKRTVVLIRNVVTCDWIKTRELKFLASSFYNIGASLYNVGEVEKASIALNICCTTSWAHVKSHGQLHEDNTTAKEAVLDAVSKSAFALNVIHKCDTANCHDFAIDCLLHWSVVMEDQHQLEISASPSSLVKRWVKIICQDFKDVGAEVSIPSLSLLLLNKKSTLSKKVFGIILEEELLAYEEWSAKCPNLFQKMLSRLIDVLLEKVYVGDEHVLQRSKLMIKKGKALKTSGGVNRLRDSFECFSKAISSLEIACDDPNWRGNYKLYYQLVQVYFLRAHFSQEANGEEEVILKDIVSALSQWSRISKDVNLALDYETTLHLFFRITDLLALKGHLHYQLEMCRLITQLCKQNNVSLESAMAMLWSNRRLSHWCCSSPIDEFFVRNISTDFGVSTDSVTFWTNYVKHSHSSLVSFRQVFSHSNSGLASENTLLSHISFEEVTRTVDSLLSCTSLTNDSAFEAGYLLFDLSERLRQKGHMFEALSHAREALRLRKGILQRKFISTAEKPIKIDKIWSSEQLFSREVGSIITEDTKHTLALDSSITPWSALRCYLQSIFQVGIIYECIGNGTEAEVLFRLGRAISSSLGFPIFSFIFSCHLGQIYRKKLLWDLTEKEVEFARSILEKITANISCNRCKAVLESLIGLQVGDLYLSKFESASGLKCVQSLSDALEQYKSAIKRLSHLDPNETTGLLSKDKDLDGKQPLCDVSLMNNIADQRKINSKAKCRSRNKTLASIQYLESERKQDISEHNHTQHVNCQNLLTIGGFSKNVAAINSMSSIILDKWEFHKRLLFLKLYSKIGKCMRLNRRNHEVHEIFWQSMSMLYGFDQTSVQDARYLGFVGIENLDDTFPVQRAILLYEMSLSCIKSCFSEGSRIKCCALSKQELPTVLSWLFTAFILAQDIPSLLQKVCRSIVVIISLSKSAGHSSLPFFTENLTETQIAVFFHQASIGSNLIHVHQLNTKDAEFKTKNLSNGRPTSHIRTIERISDLEQFIITFFRNLPDFTVICISLLGGECVDILGETLLAPSFYPAWILLSRMDRNGPPTFMLLPADFINEEAKDNFPGVQTACLYLKKEAEWECPWDNTLAGHVAPEYKMMLEENHTLLRTSHAFKDTPRNMSIWWSKRSRLNKRMDMFLRRMEDLWFGPWRCLLLAEHTNFKSLNTVLEGLKNALEYEYELDANISFLRIIVGGSKSLRDVEACLAQVIQYKGYLGRGKCDGVENLRVFGESKMMPESIRTLVLEAFNVVAQEVIEREPVVLVLDSDLQMLPWESVPILRKEEVYRMPTMSSIILTLSKNSQHLASEPSSCSIIPSIDPLDAYFLSNPGGDLSVSQLEFEEWLRLHNWTGKAGTMPTMEELLEALQNHDLFLYFGHGSGEQYISGKAIQRLDRCAATLLMGCSSGHLSIRGNYVPEGAPLSYLLAGSPAVIANLWDISIGDIGRFGKSILTSWLLESTAPGEEGKHGGEVQRTRRRPLVKDSGRDVSRNRRVASCMGLARDACKLPYLVGAAPVCFGVPTLIKRGQKR